MHDDDDSHTSPTLEMVFNLEAASVGYSFVWVEKQPVDGATSVFSVKVHLAPVVSSYTVFFSSNCKVTLLLFHIVKNITISNLYKF